MAEKEFSTFEVGKICNVAHTTVINWVDRDQIPAHSTPGGHRRVYLDDLIVFLKKYKMRVPASLRKTKKKPCVLIVDDEPEVLDMLAKAFKADAPGFKVLTTNSGMEALILVGSEVPDVVILDVVIPNMDGLDVCRTLKAASAYKHIKILVITGNKLTETQHDYFLETVDGIFYKPFSAAKLVERSVQALKE